MTDKKIKKIWFVATYVPMECGIATYTKNLIDAIHSADSDVVCNVAVMKDEKDYKFPSDVKLVINQNKDEDYVKAAEAINASDADLVSIQHEYGIFGGFNGRKLLLFLKNLKKPVFMTLHTVSIAADKPFKIVPKRHKSRMKLMKKISRYVDGFTVMTQGAKEYLVSKQNIPARKINVIPHGAPVITEEEKQNYRKLKTKLGFGPDDFVITTFGLISPKKGLQYVVQSLPKIIQDNPDKKIKYLIAGKTHPKQSPLYMESLKNMVEKLAIKQNVVFDSRYLDADEIYRYLVNSDIYITPYFVKEQASSGTLSYAIACGCCIISTPYVFAKDFVSRNKTGELVKFRDANSISAAVNKLIDNPKLAAKYQKISAELGKKIFWPKIGRSFLEAFKKVI